MLLLCKLLNSRLFTDSLYTYLILNTIVVWSHVSWNQCEWHPLLVIWTYLCKKKWSIPDPTFFHGRGNKRCHLLGTRKRKNTTYTILWHSLLAHPSCSTNQYLCCIMVMCQMLVYIEQYILVLHQHKCYGLLTLELNSNWVLSVTFRVCP